MFDKLVESAKEKQGRRAKRFFLATGAVYAVALVALGIAAIIGFNSALAEESDIISCFVYQRHATDRRAAGFTDHLYDHQSDAAEQIRRQDSG